MPERLIICGLGTPVNPDMVLVTPPTKCPEVYALLG
jgi:hypothetical protein